MKNIREADLQYLEYLTKLENTQLMLETISEAIVNMSKRYKTKSLKLSTRHSLVKTFNLVSAEHLPKDYTLKVVQN